MQKEKIVVRHLGSIPLEAAHDGAGRRQLVFSNPDIPNSKLEAVTVGFLPAKGRFKAHKHDGIDEVMMMRKGCGRIESGKKKLGVSPGDFVLFPAGVTHAIINTGKGKLAAQFIRFRR